MAQNLTSMKKKIVFAQPGVINANICISLSLPEAQPGQLAYVYLVNENGSEMIYLPAVVDTDKKISIPVNTKSPNLSIKILKPIFKRKEARASKDSSLLFFYLRMHIDCAGIDNTPVSSSITSPF